MDNQEFVNRVRQAKTGDLVSVSDLEKVIENWREYRETCDRYVPSPLLAYQDFVRSTGTTTIPGITEARTCSYCAKAHFSPSGQCQNCGART